MFKCLRRKSVVRYKMYRDLIKKKKFRLQGRWKKKKRYLSRAKLRVYRVARSLRFRRTKFPWFKKKRYSKHILRKFRSNSTARFWLSKNHVFFTDLFFFEKSKKFCYVVWLYNLHIFFQFFSIIENLDLKILNFLMS